MMELTRKGDYAIRGIVYLASQPPNKISLLGEIAEAYGRSANLSGKNISAV